MVRAVATLLAAAAALVAAAAITAPAAAAAAKCGAPFDLNLVGRTFTTNAANQCSGSSKDAARYATITTNRILFDLTTDRGVSISATALEFGEDWVKPVISYTTKERTTKAGAWGSGRALFVDGLGRLIREFEGIGGACKANEDLYGVVSYLRVLAYQYQLPSSACLG